MKFLGITNRTQAILFAVFILIALLIAFDPFHWSNAQPTVQANVDSKRLEKAKAALLKEAKPAKEQVVRLFDNHRLVIVGEHELIKDELDFVADLMPDLLKAGVRNIGVEFLLSANQADIDLLISGKTFEPALAQRLLFQRLPIRGYKEYINFMQAVWAANSVRPADAAALRLIGLGITQDYSMVKQFEDLHKKEIMKQVLRSGIIEDEMFKTVLHTLGIDPAGKGVITDLPSGKKMLLFVPQISANPRWEDGSYQDEMMNYDFQGKRRLAPLLHDRFGEALAAVAFYHPVPFLRNRVGENFPDEGLIDSIIAKTVPDALPALPIAINLRESLFGKISLDQTELGFWSTSRKKAAPLWSDLADVLVVFGRISSLKLVEPIDNFITDQNLAAALALMPQNMDRAKTKASIMNDSIKNFPLGYRKVLESFR